MIRVCETEANSEGRISNFTSLSSNGIEQAERIRNRLRCFNIQSIYSSEFESALKNAKIIAEAFDLPIIKCPEFNETDLGDWDGLKKVDIARSHKEKWEEWLNNPTEQWKFPGARETLGDVQIRATKKLKEIVFSHKENETLCIVSHGNIIRVILCFILNFDLSNMLKFHQFNGAITAFEYDRKNVRIQFVNDTCHLIDMKFSDSITGRPWIYKN